jgi:hypothetical protein
LRQNLKPETVAPPSAPPPEAAKIPTIEQTGQAPAPPEGTINIDVRHIHPEYHQQASQVGPVAAQRAFTKDDFIGKYLADKENMDGVAWKALSIEQKEAMLKKINKDTGKGFKSLQGKGNEESRSMTDVIDAIAKRADFHWNKPQVKPIAPKD